MEFELFHGPVTTTETVLYAQVRRPAEGGEWQLRGELYGPFNERAETLPTKLQFQDAGPGDTVLARVRVPDPCSWTMDLPSLYKIELELFQGDSPVARWQGVSGFRDFGVAGRSFSLNGERWVLRAARATSQETLNVETFRDQRLACFCGGESEDGINESFLRTACEQGVSLAVKLPAQIAAAELNRLARWPAVLAVIFPAPPDVLDAQKAIGPDDWVTSRANVAVGCFADAEQAAALANAVSVADNEGSRRGIDFVCVSATDAQKLSESRIAIVAYQDIEDDSGAKENSTTKIVGRAACDQLQAQLAPGNFAGFIVDL